MNRLVTKMASLGYILGIAGRASLLLCDSYFGKRNAVDGNDGF